MKTHEKYETTLMEIETAINKVYRANRDLTDSVVIRSLETAESRYRALVRGHTLKEVTLTDLDRTVFEAMEAACGKWMRADPSRPGSPLDASAMLDCVRQLLRSAQMWNKQHGRQGYLDYAERWL